MTGVAADQRLRRRVQLTDARQFRRVFERAIRSNGLAFTVLARVNQCEHARLGLAISRKCAGRATQRNRIKRLVRESFRAAQHELPAVDVVVMCRPVVNDMTNRELTAALEGHWRQLRARCKNF